MSVLILYLSYSFHKLPVLNNFKALWTANFHTLYPHWSVIQNYQLLISFQKCRGIYRITGIFCGCLIFAEFCGSIEIAEIKNRKIFQSRYNDEFVSEVIVQSRIFRCLSGIVVELSVYCSIHIYIMYTWIWDCDLNGMILLSAIEIFHGNYSDECLTHLVL